MDVNERASVAVRVLVVEDFQPFRRWVCSILSEQPELQVVGEAADGLAAVQKARELQPDLVLLDIGLANLNGIEAAGQIRQASLRTKIVFLTQITDPEVIRGALSIGAQGCVLKADAGTELLSAIKAVLRGENFVSRRLES